jgi:DNA repair protein RecO (recombination protein O)
VSDRRRVDGEPAFVLHSYPFRETSLIVEAFSRHHGRVALLARGARRPRSALRGLLMAFQPLELGWAGKGEVLTLMKAEWRGGQPLLQGAALFCGYYLNELLLKLLPREDAHEVLFDRYAVALAALARQVEEASLRGFEADLLRELGYGLNLARDANGTAIDPAADYRYEIERGAVPAVGAAVGTGVGEAIAGKTLLDLAERRFDDPQTLAQSKRLMRTLINHYLAGRELSSRTIFRELQET